MNDKKEMEINMKRCKPERFLLTIGYAKLNLIFIKAIEKNEGTLDLIKNSSKKYQIDEPFLFCAIKKIYGLNLAVDIDKLASNLANETMFNFITTEYGYSIRSTELLTYFKEYLFDDKYLNNWVKILKSEPESELSKILPKYKKQKKQKDWYRKFDNKQRFQKGEK